MKSIESTRYKRNRAARENRRLKANGYIHTPYYGWKPGPRDSYLSSGIGFFLSRQEAIAHLDKNGEQNV